MPSAIGSGAGAALFLTVVAVGGCAVSQSSLLQGGSGKLACETSAGSYNLGRTLFNIKISSTGEQYYLGGVTTVRAGDPANAFCLNYRTSWTSEEAFIVKKTNEGLLRSVTSNSDDKSADVAKKLVQTFFVALSQNAAFPSASDIAKSTFVPQLSNTEVVNQTYDPYNDGEAGLLNNAIKDFGFCLVMEDQQIAPGYHSVGEYCDFPLKFTRIEGAMTAAAKSRAALPSVHDGREGIFYRPRQTRTVYLFIKQDLRKAGGWKLRASQAVSMENIAPVMFVGIDRTFFAKRETTVNFDDGALTDVNIRKDSELVGFVSIPLYIAQSIIALPAQIVKVKIDTSSDKEKLIKARSDLIAAENALLELQNKSAAGAGSGTDTGTGSKFTGARTGFPGVRVLSSADTPEQWCGATKYPDLCIQDLKTFCGPKSPGNYSMQIDCLVKEKAWSRSGS